MATSTSASCVWVYWTTGTSCTCTAVWDNWCDTYDATCSTSTNTTWGSWVAVTGSCNARVAGQQHQQSPEEIEAERLRIAEAAARREEESQKAEKRAADLLWECLDAEQRKAFKKDKKFHVTGSDGVRYEIDCTKRMHNVFAVDEKGERVREFCAYQTGDTPLSDNALAQKLALETDAERFHRVANKWDLTPRRVAV